MDFSAIHCSFSCVCIAQSDFSWLLHVLQSPPGWEASPSQGYPTAFGQISLSVFYSKWFEPVGNMWQCSLIVWVSVVQRWTFVGSFDNWNGSHQSGCWELSHHYQQQSFLGPHLLDDQATLLHFSATHLSPWVMGWWWSVFPMDTIQRLKQGSSSAPLNQKIKKPTIRLLDLPQSNLIMTMVRSFTGNNIVV